MRPSGCSYQPNLARRLAAVLAVITALLFSGCSSIPVSTMIRMSQFDDQQLVALDPEQLRAKVTVERHIGLKSDQTKLSLTMRGANGELSREFDFELASFRDFEIEAWFSEPTEWRSYQLKLTPAGVDAFRALQQFVAEDPVPDEFSLGVSAKVRNPPPEGETIILSIALKLAADEEFMVLFDNAEVVMGKSEI